MAPARMKIVGREERRKKRTPCGGVQLETRPLEGAGRGLTVGAPAGWGLAGRGPGLAHALGTRRHASTTAIALSRVSQAPVGPGKYAPVNCTQPSYTSNPDGSHATSSRTPDSPQSLPLLAPACPQFSNQPAILRHAPTRPPRKGAGGGGFPARGSAAAGRNVASGLGDPGPAFHESPRR